MRQEYDAGHQIRIRRRSEFLKNMPMFFDIRLKVVRSDPKKMLWRMPIS
jgi:hypothetical protein